jgi:hypothetical protein
MIETRFYNIQEAISYLSQCLLCKYSMGLGNLSGSSTSQISIDHEGYGDFQPVITYSILDKPFEDRFMIGVKNNSVRREIVKNEAEEMISSVDDFTMTRVVKHHGTYPMTAGVKYLSLVGSCNNCHKYGFVLQLIIELQTLKMFEVVFNSETLTFQTDTMSERWELKNIYTTKKTIYTHFAPPKPGLLISEAKQDLPLLPINREDPAKTLKRVKNLLIFT